MTPSINAGFVLAPTVDLLAGDPIILTSLTAPTALTLPLDAKDSLEEKEPQNRIGVGRSDGPIILSAGGGGWEIDISATLIATDYNLTPQSLLYQLRQIRAAFKGSKVKVTSARYNQLGIQFIRFDQITLPAGTFNVQKFQLHGWSDYRYNLTNFASPDAYAPEAGANGGVLA